MKHQWWKMSVAGGVGAVVGLLIVATGLCLFHIDHHTNLDGGMCQNPCAGLVSSFVVALLSSLLAAHYLAFDKTLLAYTVPIRVLDPPPRALTLF